jgi:D-arabinose 1-dehydrogenase-like Zn-dependent alcohol dehydrogenase
MPCAFPHRADPVQVAQIPCAGITVSKGPEVWRGAARRHIVFNGLPAGDFPASILVIVLKGLTVGSIVGTRQDMREALDFYSRGQINATLSTRDLSEINAVLDEWGNLVVAT